MFIKRFEASTLLQAVEQVRAELGSNAVILSTRSVKSKALLPWLRKPVYEVIAAKYDDDAKGDFQDGQALPSLAPPEPPKGVELRPGLDVMIDDDDRRYFTGGMQPEPRVPSAPKVAAQGVKPGVGTPVNVAQPSVAKEIEVRLQPIKDDIAQIKERIAALAMPERHQAAVAVEPEAVGVPTSPVSPVVQAVRNEPEGIVSLEEFLFVSGIGVNNVEKIVGGVKALASPSDLESSDRTYDKAREVLRGILAQSREWGDSQPPGPRRIALIGPTGVGKTTTLAKLAARYVLMQNKTLSLVAADTYRVAAVSQLKMYGELLGVEVDVVHNPAEMSAVVEARGNKDIILIDTAGRSQRNGGSLETLRDLLTAANPTEIHLVLSVTTKLSDLQDVVNRFAPLQYDRLLFTKLDESENYGDMVEIVLKASQPVSFLTTGQSVPSDIEVATADRVMSLLLPDPGSIRG